MASSDDELDYLSEDDVLTLHEVIVENGDDTEPGISSPGDVEYVVESIREGHFGQKPATVHEAAAQLMRLLVANHPFVDGNKRTALSSTVVFYALNGYDLEYGPEIKAILKRFATDEAGVDRQEVIDYLETQTSPLPEEYAATYEVLRNLGAGSHTGQNGEQNDYADGEPTGE